MQSSMGVPGLEAGEIDLIFVGSRRGSGDGLSIQESVSSGTSSGKRSWADDTLSVPWGAASGSRRGSADRTTDPAKPNALSPRPCSRASPLPTIESPLLPRTATVDTHLFVDTDAAVVPTMAYSASPASSRSSPTVLNPYGPSRSNSNVSRNGKPRQASSSDIVSSLKVNSDSPTTTSITSSSLNLLTTAEVINAHNRLASISFEPPSITRDTSDNEPKVFRAPADEALRSAPGVIGLGEGWASVKQPRRRSSWFSKPKPVELDPLTLWESTAQVAGPSKPSTLAGMKESFNRSRQALFGSNPPTTESNEEGAPLSTLAKAKAMFSRSRLDLSSPSEEQAKKDSSVAQSLPSSPSPRSISGRISRASSVATRRSSRSSRQPPSPVQARSTSLGSLPGLPPPPRKLSAPYQPTGTALSPSIMEGDEGQTSPQPALATLSKTPSRHLRRMSTFGPTDSSVSPINPKSEGSTKGLVGMLPLNDIDPFETRIPGAYPYSRKVSAAAFSSHVDVTNPAYRTSESVAEQLINLPQIPRTTTSTATSRRKSWLPATFSTDNLSRHFSLSVDQDEEATGRKKSLVKRMFSRKSVVSGMSKSSSAPQGFDETRRATLPTSLSMPYSSNLNESTMSLDLDFDSGDLGLDDILDSRRRARIVRSIKVDEAAAQDPSSPHRTRIAPNSFSIDEGIAEESETEEDSALAPFGHLGPLMSTDSLGSAMKAVVQFPMPPTGSMSNTDSSPESDYRERLSTPQQSPDLVYDGDIYTTLRPALSSTKMSRGTASPSSPAMTTSSTIIGSSQSISPKSSWNSHVPTVNVPSLMGDGKDYEPMEDSTMANDVDFRNLSMASDGGAESESGDSSLGDESVVHGHAVHVKSIQNLASRASYIDVQPMWSN